MTLILRRLETSCGVIPPPCKQSANKIWTFTTNLQKKTSDFFQPFLKQHNSIVMEYEVLQTMLGQNIAHQDDLLHYEEQLIEALQLAEILQYHYAHYFSVPREALRFKQDGHLLKAMLSRLGYQFPQTSPNDILDFKEYHISQTIRRATTEYNVLRSTIQRSRSLLLQTSKFFFEGSPFQLYLKEFDVYLRPAINYLIWFYFIPRLVNNLVLLVKHLIPGPWMSQSTKSLPLSVRLNMQLNRRGFEIADDLGWFLSSMSLCLIWIGPNLPWAFTANLFQRSFELLCRLLKATVKIKQMQKLQKAYQHMMQKDDISTDEQHDIETYFNALEQRIHFEINKLCLDTLNSAVILTSVIMLIPLLPASPWVPFLGAVLALAATGIFYGIGKYMDNHHPNKGKTLANQVSHISWFSSQQSNKTKQDNNHKKITLVPSLGPIKCSHE